MSEKKFSEWWRYFRLSFKFQWIFPVFTLFLMHFYRNQRRIFFSLPNISSFPHVVILRIHFFPRSNSNYLSNYKCNIFMMVLNMINISNMNWLTKQCPTIKTLFRAPTWVTHFVMRSNHSPWSNFAWVVLLYSRHGWTQSG